MGEVPLNRCVSILGSVPLSLGSLVGALRLNGLLDHPVLLKHVGSRLLHQFLLHGLHKSLDLWSPQYFGERIPMQTNLPGNLPELHAPETQVQDLKVSQLLFRTQGYSPRLGAKGGLFVQYVGKV